MTAPPAPVAHDRKKVVLGCLIIFVAMALGLLALLLVISLFLPDELPTPQSRATGLPSAPAASVAAPSTPAPPPTLGPDVPVEEMARPAPKPVDISSLYVVTKDDHMGAMKRTVAVQLFAHQNEATLEAIARALKSRDVRQYERTYITFDVRGEPKPEGMSNWAVARFDPDFRVDVYGDP